MSVAKRSVWIGAALCSAAAISLFMHQQHEKRVSLATTGPEADLAVPAAQEQPEPELTVSAVTLTSASLLPVASALVPPADQPVPAVAAPADDAPADAVIDSCDISLRAAPQPPAMVALDLHAPCHGGTPAIVHHNGMSFSLMTDAEGHARASVPALSQQALFIAAFPDGESAVDLADLPDFDAFGRVVLQWQGDAGFQLHAREDGADYDTNGHLWAASLGDHDRALSGQGGFLVPLGDGVGDPAHRAEVYVFPKSPAPGKAVAVTAEVVVTAANCDRQISAMAIRDVDGRLSPVTFELTMPGCDGIGDILLLKDLTEDMKIASN